MIKLCALLVLFCAGCATNPYKEFFHPLPEGYATPIVPENERVMPKVLPGTDRDADIKKLTVDGYAAIGYSSFTAADVDTGLAAKYGSEIGADLVLVSTKYQSTRTGAVPITTPTTQTSYSNLNAFSGGQNYSGNVRTTTYGSTTNYVPYSVDRYSYEATYWIKARPSIFGAQLTDPTPERRAEIGSNTGAQIALLIKGQPAFKADFLEGDVIRKINGREVSEPNDFIEATKELAGKKVTVEFMRGSKPMKKSVQLNE